MQALTIKEIVDSFPDECKTILPREVKRLLKITREFDRQVKIVELRHFDKFTEWFAIEWLKILFVVNQPGSPWAQLKHLEDIQEMYNNPPSADPYLDPPSNKITDDQIARAKQRPILELYAFDKVKRTGGRVTCLCPFHHEKSGSFVIYPNNSAHCFGCQLSFQDPIAFVMHPKVQGLSFPQAVRYLAGV